MAQGDRQETAYLAVRVARLYYFQNMTTAAIADEIGTSRATVSRLLSFALERGLVEIRVHDPQQVSGSLEAAIANHYRLRSIQVVPVAAAATDKETLQRVTCHAAAYVNSLVTPGTIIGLAWGTTVAQIADQLLPRHVHDVDVVALNGSGSGASFINSFSESIVSRFAQNYGARAHHLPVPAFFDYPDTRTALWREKSIKAIRDLQERASILLFSIGAEATGSYIHTAGYLGEEERQILRDEGLVGDIATVFFRADGSWRDVAFNARNSGPDMECFTRAAHSLCVVSGAGKLPGLKAALRGGFINELIIDEPSARLLVEQIRNGAAA